MAHVAHPHGPRVGGQCQLVTGATAAVNVPTVSTVVLQHIPSQFPLKRMTEKVTFERSGGRAHLPACDGELLLTLLAVCGFVVFKPGVALTAAEHTK